MGRIARSIVLLLLLGLILPATARTVRYRTADDACRQMVEALRQKNFDLLSPVLFDLKDDAAFDSLFRSTRGVTEDTITEYNVSRSDVKEDFRRNLAATRGQFQRILTRGESLGIVWSKATYDGYEVQEQDGWLGYEVYYAFTIHIKYKRHVYILNPGILRRTPNGWRLASAYGCDMTLK